MKILVTGSTGFIGKALVSHLMAHGHVVLCAGRRNPEGQSANSFIAVGNIDSRTDWQKAFQGVDAVVHLAGRAHVLRASTKDDALLAFREINVGGTLNLARQAISAGVNRIVFVSSIGVLGRSSLQPFREMDPPAPVEPYALSKWEAEKGLIDLLAMSSTQLVIIRPPLVYGPNAPGNFGRLVRAVRSGALLPFGAVNNRRTLVALGNLVDLIRCCASHPSAANQVFLAGDGEDLSTTELLQRLGRALDRPARLIPVPVWFMQIVASALGRGTVVQKLCSNLQVDTSKAQQLLGWTPPFSVDDGLRQVAERQ